MKIADGVDIETGVEYYWKRTDGWDWNGDQRWWEVFVEFTGFNGVGGVWLVERWRWNGSDQTMREQPRTLSLDESREVIEAVRENLRRRSTTD